MKKGEKWLEKELTRRVKNIGGKALKISSGTDTGYPDRLILLRGGTAIWAEIKSEGEKPRKLQTFRHDRLRDMGFAVFVIDSEEVLDYVTDYMEDIKEFQEQMSEYEQE